MREPRVVYRDNHLLVLDKPAPMLTQSNGSGQLSLHEWAKESLGIRFLEPIHRLDRVTSGLVIFACSSKALSRSQASMRRGEIRKWYEADVEGRLPASKGTLEHHLIHGDHRAAVVSEDYPHAKLARLHYRKIGVNRLEIALETGRYHQIRAQLAHIGCPIVGDGKYGASKSREAILLAHVRCELPHPVRKFEPQLPVRFSLRHLRGEVRTALSSRSYEGVSSR